MAIFKHLIPAKHRDEKRNMTSGHDDRDEGHSRHRRHHGRRHTHHGHYW